MWTECYKAFFNFVSNTKGRGKYMASGPLQQFRWQLPLAHRLSSSLSVPHNRWRKNESEHNHLKTTWFLWAENNISVPSLNSNNVWSLNSSSLSRSLLKLVILTFLFESNLFFSPLAYLTVQDNVYSPDFEKQNPVINFMLDPWQEQL